MVGSPSGCPKTRSFLAAKGTFSAAATTSMTANEGTPFLQPAARTDRRHANARNGPQTIGVVLFVSAARPSAAPAPRLVAAERAGALHSRKTAHRLQRLATRSFWVLDACMTAIGRVAA